MAFPSRSYPLSPEQQHQLAASTVQAGTLGMTEQYHAAQATTLAKLNHLIEQAPSKDLPLDDNARRIRVQSLTRTSIFAALEADAYFAFGISLTAPSGLAADLYVLKVDTETGSPLKQSQVQIGSAHLEPTLRYTADNGFDVLMAHFGAQKIIEQHQADLHYLEFGSVATLGWLLEYQV
ncbi:MAG: hypothetical protein JWM81_1101 [Candidatus Saccharibacteria bacterium]|nr:hypothetical protein [Candidatus Saccharibacteria bacterium]